MQIWSNPITSWDYNSLNVSRVLMQIVHFFYAYFCVCTTVGDEVIFSIPTGGCGNLAAGVIARLMGLPVKFIVAVNHNDIIHRAISSGAIQRPKQIIHSHASGIDAGSPSNMERVLALLTDDAVLIAKQMSDWESCGKVDLTSFQLIAIQKLMWSTSVSEQEILDVIKEVKTQHDYDICPQTAVAISAAQKFSMSRQGHERLLISQTVTCLPVVCLSTASLAKYTGVGAKAGVAAPCPPAFKALYDLPQKMIQLCAGEDWEKIIRDRIDTVKLRWKAGH